MDTKLETYLVRNKNVYKGDGSVYRSAKTAANKQYRSLYKQLLDMSLSILPAHEKVYIK